MYDILLSYLSQNSLTDSIGLKSSTFGTSSLIRINIVTVSCFKLEHPFVLILLWALNPLSQATEMTGDISTIVANTAKSGNKPLYKHHSWSRSEI